MTKKLKAYRVDSGDNEGSSKIIFAEHNAVARRRGANEFDLTFEEIEACRRAPNFDQYAPGPVPPTALIADGWWQECLHCGVTVREDGEAEDEDGNYVEFQPVDYGDQVFCCPACQGAHFAERRANQAARTAMMELVEARFPDCTVTRIHVYGTKLEPSEPHGGMRCFANFMFPGAKYGATYIFGDPEHAHVAQGDLDAFHAWRGARA